MKYPLLILGFCTSMYAQTMSASEHLDLHRYNHRPSLKHMDEKNAHRLHKIDEDQARKIAARTCRGSDVKLTLTHRGSYLYYIARTTKCTVYINALDGTVIDPKKINTENTQ